MVSLFMIVIFAMVVGRVAGAALGVGPRSHWHRRHRARMRHWALQEEAVAPVLPAPPPETPLEKLQRQFARGDMSVEQYERELNRMYGIRG